MNSSKVLLLVLYAFGMSAGQVLFKLSAQRAKGGSAATFLLSLAANGYFVVAVVVYAVLTVLWVWLLTRVPLSLAYPFIALAFVFTPALAWLLLGEPVRAPYLLGLALILLGLAVVVWKGG